MLITLEGVGFVNSVNAFCHFDAASLTSQSRNGQQFSAAALTFAFLEPIQITDVEPTKRPVVGEQGSECPPRGR